MKLYKVWQDQQRGYDTFSDMVVCASDVEEARSMHPCDMDWPNHASWTAPPGVWCESPADAHVEYLGEAREGLVKSVICTSFHAG